MSRIHFRPRAKHYFAVALLLSLPAGADTPFLVKDILTAVGAGAGPSGFVDFNGEVYFSADDGINGRELWKTDGTTAGTVLVVDIFPGSGSSGPADLAVSNGALFFQADDGLLGRELWKTDGSALGTEMVADINAGNGSSNPQELTDVGGALFFQATDGVNG